jgi:hypothetical protein
MSDMLAPPSFEFSHVMAIVAVLAMGYLLRKLFLSSRMRIVRFTSAAFLGVLGGVLSSYIFAHLAVPLLGLWQHGRAGFPGGFMFWSLFIGISFIGGIAGGLGGIIYARKRDEEQYEGEEQAGAQKDKAPASFPKGGDGEKKA